MEAAGRGALELRRQMAAQRAVCERQIAAGKERAASAAATYRAALLSARSHSHQAISRQEELPRLKGQFGELEAELAKVLSIKVSKDSEFELTKESISRTAATNEQLKNLLTDQRNKRDQYATFVSNQREAVEALEAKSNINEKWRKSIEEAAMWYHKFLGFEVVGGEGVRFVFNKVDLKSPGKEYTFSIKLDKDRYNLLQCDPHIKGSEELMKDLNRTNDLFKFVRIIRQRFQAATVNGILPVSSVVCPDASSIAISSPVVMSVDARRENVAGQSHSRIKNNKHTLPPAKRRAAALSAASPGAVVSNVHRSPRFLVAASRPPARRTSLRLQYPGAHRLEEELRQQAARESRLQEQLRQQEEYFVAWQAQQQAALQEYMMQQFGRPLNLPPFQPPPLFTPQSPNMGSADRTPDAHVGGTGASS